MIFKTVHRKLKKKDKPTNYDLQNSTQEAKEKDKPTNYDLRNSTQEAKELTRTPLKTGDGLMLRKH
jgi:hypothetical protein